MLEEPKWGIDVPSCCIQGHSPTFGSLILFFFRKSTTRSYYLMNFSQSSMRGAEIWHIWKQHHVIECFWKIIKSIFHMRSMQLQDDGLYTALLLKVFAYHLVQVPIEKGWKNWQVGGCGFMTLARHRLGERYTRMPHGHPY